MPFYVFSFDKVTEFIVERHPVDPELSAPIIMALFGLDEEMEGDFAVDEERARLLQPYVSAQIDTETYDWFVGEEQT